MRNNLIKEVLKAVALTKLTLKSPFEEIKQISRNKLWGTTNRKYSWCNIFTQHYKFKRGFLPACSTSVIPSPCRLTAWCNLLSHFFISYRYLLIEFSLNIQNLILKPNFYLIPASARFQKFINTGSKSRSHLPWAWANGSLFFKFVNTNNTSTLQTQFLLGTRSAPHDFESFSRTMNNWENANRIKQGNCIFLKENSENVEKLGKRSKFRSNQDTC